MRYWFDTEFIENGRTIDLISHELFRSDGREYYAVSTQFNQGELFANPWLMANVFPSLPFVKYKDCCDDPTHNYIANTNDSAWKDREEIAQDIIEFCGAERYGKPEFWAYYADYDWVALCQLFGRMIDLPKGWPMYCRDIKQWADEIEVVKRELGEEPTYKLRLPEQGGGEHNALADARWNRTAWDYLHSLAWL
jgi:hypothetical protein